MDLSIRIQDTTLYVRVAGLIKTKQGFLFEKSDKGYIYTVGGKVKLNETSAEAIQREILEELGIRVKSFFLCSIMENFFARGSGEHVHELCFIYTIQDIYDGVLPKGFVEVSVEEFDRYDIRPNAIVPLLSDAGGSFKHIIKR